MSCFLVTFIWGNSDINPEKLTGVSMHYINGIMVQICTKREAVSINKRDRDIRSKNYFRPFPIEWLLTCLKSELVQTHLEESIKPSLKNSQCIDFIWVLCNYLAPEKIPNSADFSYLIHEKRGKWRHSKSYLSPNYRRITKLGIVLEMPLQSKAKAIWD